MKYLFVLMTAILSITCYSQTQGDINQNAYDEFKEADKKLNEVYRTIISEYKKDTIFINNLVKSQRLWIQFRDAELEMKYPQYGGKYYGSVLPMCKALYLKNLTNQRIETLKNWIKGADEGEACNGSVNMKTTLNPTSIKKALIRKDRSIVLTANMKTDHRIVGFKKKNIYSKKMILLSIFTHEVENNPFNCKYGAYYDTNGMGDMRLKYISTEDDFIKVEILKDDKKLDKVYMLKDKFEFLK
ncbi:lysozyme inhibitor LprI family protein [Christiangramia aquimixticola]|uniref:lysozyme inhibitor LprI family protein n=1 Tax=Christiangramia aquimixticola TaxID=1697558 RepID=UPI003AA9776C